MYEAHSGYVWTNLRAFGVDPADLEDAAQEVFVILHRRADIIDATRPLRPWLFGVCRRVASSYRRCHAARSEFLKRIIEPISGDEGEARFEAQDAARVLDAFLADLNPTQREVFLLAEVEQMTAKEIASSLGVSANTVASRRRLARHAFDRHLQRLRARDRSGLHEVRRDTAPASERSRTWVWLPMLRVPLWVGAVVVAASVVGAAIAIVPRLERERRPEIEPARSVVHELPVEAKFVVTDEEASMSCDPFPMAERDETADSLPSTSSSSGRQDVRPRPSEPAFDPPPPPTTLAHEVAILSRAHGAFEEGRPQDAIAICHDYEQRFATANLLFECAQIELGSLCRLGRDAEMRDRVAALRHEFTFADDEAANLLTSCDSVESTQGRVTTNPRSKQ